MRVIVIVSKDKSDIYFANQLSKRLNVTGIVVENQTSKKDRAPLLMKGLKYLTRPSIFLKKSLEIFDRKFIDPYQDYRNEKYSVNFGSEGRTLVPRKTTEILYTEGVNAINSPEYESWIRKKNPDVIAVCGASILKRNILSIPKYGVLNLHGGLSQFYRGLFTTDWAIYNNEPECVGATVHFVSGGIDDGDIVYQGRPNIVSEDHPNSLYEKVVKLGIEMMIRAIADIECSQCKSTRLINRGPLYLNSMFDVRRKRKTWRQVRKGIIPAYLENKKQRDERVLEAIVNDFSEIH